MTKHTDKELDATAVHVKALRKILDAHSAGYIVRACSVFADIEEGISLIVRKDHYYQLEAQANSHEDLLMMCGKLANIAEVVGHCVGTWTPGHQALAQEYAAEAREVIAKATE